MQCPSEIALLVHIAAHGWLSLGLSLIDWTFAAKPDPPPAIVIESRGPNDLERSCQ